MQVTGNNDISDKIFSVQSQVEFNDLALEIFRYQYAHNIVYQDYVKSIGRDVYAVKTINDIPFLPVSFFKTHTIICGDKTKYNKIFTSSSTTSSMPSRHFVKDISVYISSFRKGIRYFYKDINEYCVLALLPSYLEREGSSLVFMADDLIKQSGHEKSGFYMDNYSELVQTLRLLQDRNQKILLLGVTYALLKQAEEHPMMLKDTIIMETGGMKGRREELPRSEIHTILKKAFGVSAIHSEYGMTELLSQGYSKGEGIFKCPPWMRIGIREIDDPFNVSFTCGRGAINIIDLANIYSCSFIATDDVGTLQGNGDFEISGRIDYSDIRGCNLMASEL